MPTEQHSHDRETIDQDLVRALAHPMRVRILEALQGRTASPTELAREFLESLGVVTTSIVPNFTINPYEREQAMSSTRIATASRSIRPRASQMRR